MTAPTTGLIGFWKCDENTGTSVSDQASVGTANNMETTGSFSSNYSWATQDDMTRLYIDGSGGWPDGLYTNPDTGIDMTSGEDITISFWAKPTDATTDRYVIWGNGDAFAVYRNSSGYYRLTIGGNSVQFNTYAHTSGTGAHIILTLDNSTNTAYMYVDGSLVQTVTGRSEDTSFSSLNVGLGQRDFQKWWLGYVSHIRLYVGLCAHDSTYAADIYAEDGAVASAVSTGFLMGVNF